MNRHGWGGNDLLSGGGADAVYARDGQADGLLGGSGRDTAVLDDLLDSRGQVEVLA